MLAQQKIGKNKAVYINYSIIGEDGQVIEQYDLPIGYIHGARSNLLEKLESALDGMAAGDRVEVTVKPEDGFGEHRPELTFTDAIENVPPAYRRLGAEVVFENEAGDTLTMRVTRIENGKVTLDGNHPLAGRTVKFIVNVLAVRDATLDEVARGAPADMDGLPMV